MISFWQELIKLLGGFAIFAAALAWLIKSLVTHFLAKDIEAYKSRIASESAKEIERFKAQLQVTATEHGVRFTKLHEKRAEVIAKLYELLKDATEKTQLLDTMIQNQSKFRSNEWATKSDAVFNKYAKDTEEICRELYDFFNKHKLYFSKRLSDQMDGLIQVTWEPSAAIDFIGVPYEFNKDEWVALTQRWDKEKDNIKSIFELIEQEFRVLLGSES